MEDNAIDANLINYRNTYWIAASFSAMNGHSIGHISINQPISRKTYADQSTRHGDPMQISNAVSVSGPAIPDREKLHVVRRRGFKGIFTLAHDFSSRERVGGWVGGGDGSAAACGVQAAPQVVDLDGQQVIAGLRQVPALNA